MVLSVVFAFVVVVLVVSMCIVVIDVLVVDLIVPFDVYAAFVSRCRCFLLL